jgi:hypothetical protein
VALAFVAEAVNLLVGEESFDGVGELELASLAGGEVLEHVEDARREDVAADDGVVGRGVFEAGLFDHVGDVEEARVVGVGGAVEDAVGGDGGAFDDFGAEDAALGFVEGFDHLLHARDFGVDDVVGEEDGEGLVADELFGHEDGVAEAEGFGLAGVGDAGEVVDGVDDVEEGFFILGGEVGFELGAGVEVVFHGGFAASGDDDDLGAAGGYSLFDSILDEGLVDEAEHLLWHGLGGGEEASAQACGGEDGLADLLRCHLFLGCRFAVGNGSRLELHRIALESGGIRSLQPEVLKSGALRER